MSKALSFLIVAVFSFSTSAASVWKVTGNGNTVYVAGTIHILSSDDYPLPSEYKEAYDASAKLYFETDIAALSSPAFQQKSLQMMTYQDGRTFKDELSSKTVNALQTHFTARGIPMENMLIFKPSMLSITLSMIEFQLIGLTSQGVDQYYSTLALGDGKPVGWLESPDAQLSFLANLGKGEEDDLIMYTLDEVDTIADSINELREQWRAGDMAAMKASQLDEMQRDFPQIYEDLLVKRNNNWMPQIREMFKTDEVEFVLVGALHLAGDHSVLKMLADEGYKVEKL